MKLATFSKNIAAASDAEFAQFVDVMKLEQSVRRQNKKSTFGPGSPVWFIGRRGVKITGFVSKVNQKTVGVDAGSQGQWRVGPSILNHA